MKRKPNFLFNELIEQLNNEKKALDETIKKMEGYAQYVKKYDLFWPYTVNAKNAEKTTLCIEILETFNRISLTREIQIASVRLSTRHLYERSLVLRRGQSEKSYTRFRGYLNYLQIEGYINFKKNLKKWSLTRKGARLFLVD